jgi:hypothetical protein
MSYLHLHRSLAGTPTRPAAPDSVTYSNSFRVRATARLPAI